MRHKILKCWPRKGWLSTVLFLTLAAVTVAVIPAQPSGASDLPSGCSRSSVKVYIRNSIPQDFRAAAINGIEWWEDQSKNWRGNGGAINIQFVSSALQADVTIGSAWLPDSGTWGYGICNGGEVVINSRKWNGWRATNSYDFFESVAAHEFGHTLGLGHAGKFDSWPTGSTPVMATCRGDADFSRDDKAGAMAIGNRSGSWFNATANSSFEDGTSEWHVLNSQLSTYNGGVDGSARYGSFTSSGTSSAIHTTNRVASAGDFPLTQLAARVNYQKGYYADTGYITLYALSRGGDYPVDNGSYCGYPSFEDANGVEKNLSLHTSGQVSFAWSSPRHCYPQAYTWNYCTVYKSVPSGGWDVFDNQVVVYNRMKRFGNYTDVKVDRTRVMLKFN